MLEDFKNYLIQEDKSLNTIKSYLEHIKKYLRWYSDSFGSEFKELFRPNILEYKSYLLNIEKLNARSINAKLSAFIKLNEFLIENKIQKDIVITKKDLVKIQSEIASPAIIKKEDVEKFRQEILKNEGVRNYAIVTILAYAGLRISEALKIKLTDFNLVSKELVVVGKRDKQRIVYLNDKIIDSIKGYLQERKNDDSNFLFVSNKGGKLDRTVINKLFNKYSDKITPHTLRHFYCSHALESGYSVHEVANQAGHSNIHTTLLYTNPNKEQMKEKANRL